MEKSPLEKQKEQIERLRKLLSEDIEETLRQMPPEKREIYEKTVELRKRIGTGQGEFDVVKAIRKLRGYDD